MAFVRRNTRTKVVVEGGRRRDIPEYPENAVREVVTNSLMHRDYGPYSDGTPCRLSIYSDRLECWNPGGIYGGQSVDDLGHENMPTRNPTLVSLLEIMRVAENRHSGIPVIRDEMRRAGLRQPVFVDSRDTFTVRLYNLPEGPSEPADGMGALSKDALIAFCDVPRSRQEVADHFGVNVSYVAHAYLNPLAEEGELVRTLPDRPRSKNQRFVARRRRQ
jgi:ATP-dependent DNA helicase RecG